MAHTIYRVHDPRLDVPFATIDDETASRLSRAGLRVTAETRGEEA